MTCLTLTVEVNTGADKECATREAIALSRLVGIPVSFFFNRVYVEVDGASDEKEIVSAISDSISAGRDYIRPPRKQKPARALPKEDPQTWAGVGVFDCVSVENKDDPEIHHVEYVVILPEDVNILDGHIGEDVRVVLYVRE